MCVPKASRLVALGAFLALALAASAGASPTTAPGRSGLLAFTRYNAAGSDPDAGIERWDLYGSASSGRRQRRVFGNAVTASWSPDGRSLAVANDCSNKYRPCGDVYVTSKTCEDQICQS